MEGRLNFTQIKFKKDKKREISRLTCYSAEKYLQRIQTAVLFK